jgi:uncharacterized membrane protein HdeD (DUF308 family)
MVTTLVRYWWAFMLRGISAILFGIAAFLWPALTLAVLVMLFGAYAFVDGVFLIVSAVGGWDEVENHWLMLLEGIVGILIGVMTLFVPGLTALGLLFYIAAWSLATGVLEIAAAIRLRTELDNEIWLLLSGTVSVVFAIILLLFPAAGALGMIWAIASYSIVFGIMLIGLSAKLYRLRPEKAYSVPRRYGRRAG